MNSDFLSPVPETILTETRHGSSLFEKIKVHSEKSGMPNLDEVHIALFGVLDNRNASGEPQQFHLNDIRQKLYGLFPGNWHLNMADLGDIAPGASLEDTYFAVRSLVRELLKKKIVPIILGGGQDLTYPQYRAYDDFGQMVNLVNIDARFDLGDPEQPISSSSYVSKMIMEPPYNLFNYSNIGYQTYYNPQSEIELMESLFFDAYRLGEVSSHIELVEPVMRDANLVSMDITSLCAETLSGSGLQSPNGFNGKEICSLARYAGISDKVSSFGIYQLQTLGNSVTASLLIAQIIWYFMEGMNYRKNERTIFTKNEFIKYQVPINDEILVFFKSRLSGRWWIELPFFPNVNNKLKKHTLLPCTHKDYLDACNQDVPERWYKARRKNEL